MWTSFTRYFDRIGAVNQFVNEYTEPLQILARHGSALARFRMRR